jgi:hypothetical protein
MVFDYEVSPHERRHGPRGYRHYQEFKPWLRDEFSFRCVFCLRRERWEADPRASFSVEHLVPTSVDPDRECDYDNLLYACVRCNSYKRSQPVDLDPCSDAYGNHLRVLADGKIKGLTRAGAALIEILALNHPDLIHFRGRVLRLCQTLAANPDPQAAALLADFLAFPDDLPDLARARPPGGNSRGEGVKSSHFVRRERGELPLSY